MSGSEFSLDFSALLGNEPLKRQLELQTERRGLSHAYIISGPAGSGRHTLARLLAAALVCSDTGSRRPCGHCSGCRKAAAGIHPDILCAGEDGKDISVSQIRELRADAYIRPNEAARKVYLLSNAQLLNPSAQNAMLKLLEDGPAYCAFLLITDNAAALLPTVRSRCEVLTLSPVTPSQAEHWLRERYPDRQERQLHRAAEACEGLLGRAVASLEGGDSAEARFSDTAAQLLTLLAGGSERGLSELCISLEKWDRDSLKRLLNECILLIRDALTLQAGCPLETDPARRRAAGQAAGLPARRLLEAVSLMEQLIGACASNIGVGHLAGWLCAGLSAQDQINTRRN